MRLLPCFGMFCVAALSATQMSAAVVVGGSTLLSQGDADQLETWLGEGPIALTNIYTKQTGHLSPSHFHPAVDGQGRTFTVMSVTPYGGSTTQIIGGYNPQSWESISNFHYTLSDAERTAFLFNLTDTVIQRQNLIGEGFDSSGEYQTHNEAAYGPAFGGYDIFVSGDLTSGYTNNYSYGGISATDDILSGPAAENFDLQFGGIEVFSISAVPELGSLLIWSLLSVSAALGPWHRRTRSISAGSPA